MASRVLAVLAAALAGLAGVRLASWTPRGAPPRAADLAGDLAQARDWFEAGAYEAVYHLALERASPAAPEPASLALALLGVESAWLQGRMQDPEALALARAARDASLRTAGGCTRDAALAALRLAQLEQARGDFAAAEALLGEARAGLTELAGAGSAEFAAVLTQGAALAQEARNDQEHAGRELALAAAIHARWNDARPLDRLRFELHEARRLHRIDERPAALALARASLARAEAEFGGRHPQTATALQNVGFCAFGLGDWARASTAFDRCAELRRANFGAQHVSLADVAFYQAHVRDALGRRGEARELLARAQELYELHLGPDAPRLILVLRRRGQWALEDRDWAAAEDLLQRAGALLAAHAPDDHRARAWVLALRARAALARGDRDGARPLLDEGLALVSQGDAASADVRDDLLLLRGWLRCREDAWVEGGEDFAAWWDSARTRLADEGPALAGLVDHAACTLAGAPDAALRAQAFEYALVALQLAQPELARQAAELDERSALGTGRAPPGHDVLIALGSAPEAPEAWRRAAWEAAAASRARVRDAVAARCAALRAGRAGGDAGLRAEFERLRGRQRELELAERSEASDAGRTAELAALRRARATAERAWLASLASVAASPGEASEPSAGRDLDALAAALEPDAVLVAWVRADLGSRSWAPHYVAFGLRAGRAEVACLARVPADELDTLAAQVASLARRPGDEAAYRDAARALRQRAWDPLADFARGASAVELVATDALALIDFDALPLDGPGPARYLCEAGPRLRLWDAERDLVAPERAPRGAQARDLLVVGDVDFGAAAPDARGWNFAALPGSRAEAQAVIELWTAQPDRRATLLDGRAATKAGLRAALAQAGVLHVATHGFFESLAPAPGAARGQAVGGAEREAPGLAPVFEVEAAVPLAGLALSGANARDDAPGAGLLLAEEVLELDLDGVELAVLSACDTGAGERLAGEGLLGLRRAFQLAGARTLVVSLWPVEDLGAAQRMRHFYAALWERGEDAATALRRAARATLDERRARGLDTHPFHWAGFVAYGARLEPRAPVAGPADAAPPSTSEPRARGLAPHHD